jgi:polar amino acid transport system permease protein
VQILIWGNLALLFQHLGPFETNDVMTPFVASVVALGLNEAAYMAEVVRGGILAVDRGQVDASLALGMSRALAMRRIILPQAMRVIIPPTGNEVISMLKTTSLVTAVPFSLELYTRTRDISAETFNPIPLLIVASIWYLFFTSVLMVGQYFLEKRFARGVGARADTVAGTVPTGVTPAVPPGEDPTFESRQGGDAR